jgi:AcrR family transcriptional regulator
MAEPTRARAKPASRASTKSRRARGSLSEEEILEGAKELVERHGLHELSMPALARTLA